MGWAPSLVRCTLERCLTMSTKAAEEKKEEFAVGALEIVYNEFSEEAKTYAIEQATLALKQMLKGEKDHFKDVAAILKADLDKKFQGTWHVVVGKHFGSFVTHEVRNIIYFFLGQVGFLLFKHG